MNPYRRRFLIGVAVVLAVAALLAQGTLPGAAQRPGKAGKSGDLYANEPIVGNLRYAAAGTFMQGSPASEVGRSSDEARFKHTLTKSLAVMETSVTRQMWADLRAAQASLPEDPSDHSLSLPMNSPVVNVIWSQTILFANLLSVQNGETRCYYKDPKFSVPVDAANYMTGDFYCNFSADGYRLPTEGEREYFARAGTTGPFSIREPKYANDVTQSCQAKVLPSLESVAWFCANNDVYGPKPVAAKKANPWHIYDVHGNVMEWCWDFYAAYPGGSATDYRGANEGDVRVIRGNAWAYNARLSRSANRFLRAPWYEDCGLGFRLVRSVASTQPTLIIVTAPTGGEEWIVGSRQKIEWTASANIAMVKIDYSTDGGKSYVKVVGSTPNKGTYAWTVPNATSDDVRIKVSDVKNSSTAGVSPGSFSIVAVPGPEIHLNRTLMSFASAPGKTETPAQEILIGNSGRGTLVWSLSSNASWLKASPATGRNRGTIAVKADPSGLSSGTLSAALTVTASGASNSPLTVNVTFEIKSSSPSHYFLREDYQIAVSSNAGLMNITNLDIDADGDQDLIINEMVTPASPEPFGNGRILAFRNNGKGAFSDVTEDIFKGNLQIASGLYTDDFNEDGMKDLFLADGGNDRVPFGGAQALLFVRRAPGRLFNETESRIPISSQFAHAATVGDIDSDGDRDIYLANISGGRVHWPYFLVNDGTGRFAINTDRLPRYMIDGPGWRKYTGCLFFDIDKDGDQDLVLGSHPGPTPDSGLKIHDTILLNDGRGYFSAAPETVLPARRFGSGAGIGDIRSADFDKDGWPDIIWCVAIFDQAGNAKSGLQLLLNNEDGTFRDATANLAPHPRAVAGLTAADFNGDGWVDICDGLNVILYNKGKATFVNVYDKLFDLNYAERFIPFDIDNDGDLDFIVLLGGKNFAIFRNLKPYPVR